MAWHFVAEVAADGGNQVFAADHFALDGGSFYRLFHQNRDERFALLRVGKADQNAGTLPSIGHESERHLSEIESSNLNDRQSFCCQL